MFDLHWFPLFKKKHMFLFASNFHRAFFGVYFHIFGGIFFSILDAMNINEFLFQVESHQHFYEVLCMLQVLCALMRTILN